MAGKTFKAIVNQEARNFLRSKVARSYTVADVWGDPKTYTNRFELDREDPNGAALRCLDWGACYDYIPLPNNRAELVNTRVRAQLGTLLEVASNDVALRFYLNIQRKLDEAGL